MKKIFTLGIVAACCSVLVSCNDCGPREKLKRSIVNALEDVDDEKSANKAAEKIDEAIKRYKEKTADHKDLGNKYFELRKSLREKEYYQSKALQMAL